MLIPIMRWAEIPAVQGIQKNMSGLGMAVEFRQHEKML